MAATSERAFRLETVVHRARQPKRVELDVYGVTGLKGQGLLAAVRTLVQQSQARHRLGLSIPKV